MTVQGGGRLTFPDPLKIPGVVTCGCGGAPGIVARTTAPWYVRLWRLLVLVPRYLFTGVVALTVLMAASCGGWPCPEPPAQATSETGHVYKRGDCWETDEQRCCGYASVDLDPPCVLRACAPADDCRRMITVDRSCEDDEPKELQP